MSHNTDGQQDNKQSADCSAPDKFLQATTLDSAGSVRYARVSRGASPWCRLSYLSAAAVWLTRSNHMHPPIPLQPHALASLVACSHQRIGRWCRALTLYRVIVKKPLGKHQWPQHALFGVIRYHSNTLQCKCKPCRANVAHGRWHHVK